MLLCISLQAALLQLSSVHLPWHCVTCSSTTKYEKVQERVTLEAGGARAFLFQANCNISILRPLRDADML
jgi:hypothetical protein